MLCVVLEMAAGELDRLHERISGRFARAEPRARVRRYVSGLVAGLERKNGWTLAEQAGEVSPDGMQRLLRRADWDVDGVRDDIRDYVVEHLGDAGGVLIADETGFIKKGRRKAVDPQLLTIALGGDAAAVLRHRRTHGELPDRHVSGVRL